MKKYTLLSLDPMYSNLHDKISELIAIKSFAISSCLANKIYLRKYKLILSVDLINQIKEKPSEALVDRISLIKTYHHAFVDKVENRSLNDDEIEYMAKYYLALYKFIQENKINMVLLHNDTRWYHHIAVEICNELKIKYLVTEQGLIRPYTTVIDNRGVNAKANRDIFEKKIIGENESKKYIPSHSHQSLISMIFFSVFIFIFFTERMNKSKTIIRYMHNNYSLRKYSRIFTGIFKRKIKSPNLTTIDKNKDIKNYALFIMQLEHDSQFLIYSKYKNNQEVIERLSIHVENLGLKLKIKKHPLDSNYYQLKKHVSFVDGDIYDLSKNSALVVTINSSAVYTALKTDKPIFLIGESMLSGLDILTSCEIEEINFDKTQNIYARKRYLRKLETSYLLRGSGMSYNNLLLSEKLKQLTYV